MIRVAVTGAKGRMGSTVVAAVTGAPDMEVVAQLDAGDPITKKTVNGAQVAVDFSVPGVTEANVHALLDAGVDVVVGTTGWTEESYARVRTHAQEAGRAVLIAPNFAMGAVLAMKFAAMAAPYFESAEVIEMHHPGKVDAPSGTALAIGEAIAAQLGKPLAEIGVFAREGHTGPRQPGSIGFSTIRGGDIVGDHTVLFAGNGEQIEIRHRATSRAHYADGSLRACRFLADKAHGLYDMRAVLGLSSGKQSA